MKNSTYILKRFLLLICVFACFLLFSCSNTTRYDSNSFEFRINGETIEWREDSNSNWKVVSSISKDDLNGKSAYELAKDLGYEGTLEEWLTSLKGIDGREIEFNVTVDNLLWRYKGEEDWQVLLDLNTLVGADGLDGKSAYEIYLETHPEYNKSESEWIEDLISGKLEVDSVSNVIEYIPTNYIRVCKGETITLPEKVIVYLKDGSYEYVDVEWLDNGINSNYLGLKEVTGYTEKYNAQVMCEVRVDSYVSSSLYIDGYVNGKLQSDPIIVTIYNDNYIKNVEVDNEGYYRFDNLDEGSFFVKIDAVGYYTSDIKKVDIASLSLDENSIYNNVKHVNFDIVSIREDGYYYAWVKDENNTTETSAYINTPTDLSFIEDNKIISDIGYASLLREKYNVVLVNDGQYWSTETVARFYELYNSLPISVVENLSSVWTLVNYNINNDILYEEKDGIYYVTVSSKAIENVTPRAALVDGEVGRYFSNRFYNAIIRFVTDGGKNAEKCETILKTNFLCSFNVPDYKQLTAGITDEDETQFMEFLPEEKLLILTMFEEMPEGMHKLPELKYLVRRKTGQSHPIYPIAAAVTWTHAAEPYIEFMDMTFDSTQGYYDTKRLIIHEKMHIFYEYHFSDALKEEWQEIGGWYENPNDTDGWSTTKQTEFVSAYGHAHNPDEDMAESAATYIINPNLLKSRSINKYNFIKNYIMNGTIYLTQIREDLTFEVYNLNPDYIYPGQIESISIKVNGGVFEDKQVNFTIRLFDNGEFSGASGAYFRIAPAAYGISQFYDVQLSADSNDDSLLQGSITISKYSYAGYWYTDQIVIYDTVGNERYESNSDYSFKLYIDNQLSDIESPELVRGSLKLSLENANLSEHPEAKNLIVEFAYQENIKLDKALVRLYCQDSTISTSIDIYADVDEIDHENQIVRMKIFIPEHYCSGTYEISEISLTDIARNNSFYHIDYGTLVDENNTIEIINSNPDVTGPVLDENDIKVSAVPSNPTAPNGETFVTLKLKMKDDISGVKIGYIKFIDPQGLIHGYWLYFPDSLIGDQYYFNGDPTEEKEYTFNITLPKGSAPGTWGIYEISITDYALNSSVYNFTEIIHFEISN